MLSLPMYYDRQGFPIPGEQTADGFLEPTLVWARMMEARDGPIAQDEFPDDTYLSTVWLGLNHGVFGPPLIFETMRFSGEGGSLPFPDLWGEQDAETECVRYASEEEALAGHREIARRLRKRWEV